MIYDPVPPFRREFDAARDPYTARVVLGLTAAATGGPFQPFDADLTALAALTGVNVIYYRSAANTWSPVTIGTGLSFSGGTLANTISAGAPTTAQYVVGAADATLSAERVGTSSTSIIWDFGTVGQALVKRAALTGDVTATQDSNATTIANDAVTYAKMQNVSVTSRVLGRITAGAGDPEELTPADLMTLLRTLTRFKVGSATRDLTTASGSQAITGVGFQPKAIILLGTMDAGTKATSIGFQDESFNVGSMYLDFAAGFGFTAGTVVFIAPTGVGSSNYQSASVSSYDSDGFTLGWTKTGAPTGTARLIYLAIR